MGKSDEGQLRIKGNNLSLPRQVIKNPKVLATFNNWSIQGRFQCSRIIMCLHTSVMLIFSPENIRSLSVSTPRARAYARKQAYMHNVCMHAFYCKQGLVGNGGFSPPYYYTPFPVNPLPFPSHYFLLTPQPLTPFNPPLTSPP